MSDTESFEASLCELMGYFYDNSYATRLCERIRRAHDREIRDVSQQQYDRGFNDGTHSMDAEHRAIAMRLRQLPLDGGSHENLSQIASAIWHSDWGWTKGACAALRDELVRLMGGVSDENVHVGGLRCDDGCMGDVSNGEDTGRTHDSSSNLDRNHMAVREGVDTVIGDSDDTCDSQCRGACAADCGRDSGKHEEVGHGGTAHDCADDSRSGSRGKLVHMDGLEPTATVTGDGLTITSEDGDELRIAKDDILLNGKSIVKESIDGFLGLTATYDVLDNERRKAIAELRKIVELRKCDDGYILEWDNIYEIFDALGVDYVGMTMAEVYENVRDRLIHLLGGDKPSGIDVLRAMDDGHSRTCPKSDEEMSENAPSVSITDELREWARTEVVLVLRAKINCFADRIDAQFDRICQQHEAVLQETIDEVSETIDEVSEQRDHWKHLADVNAKALLRMGGENASLKAECEKLEKQRDLWHQEANNLMRRSDDMERERDELRDEYMELQAKLDEYERTHMKLPRDKDGIYINVADTVRINDGEYGVYAVSNRSVWLNPFDDDLYRLYGYPADECKVVKKRGAING